MATYVPQEQCPSLCHLCNRDPKIKWKCLDCALLMCIQCKNSIHNKIKTERQHRIIDIKEVTYVSHQAPATDVNITSDKKYSTKMDYIRCLAVSLDGSLWIGDGKVVFHPFTYVTHATALQKVIVEDDKLKVISSFNVAVLEVAVTSTNDLLLATGESRLKQISQRSSKIIDSKYCADFAKLERVHVGASGRVVVAGEAPSPYKVVVIVMNIDGSVATVFDNDKNNKPIIDSYPQSITSTTNGNIFVVDGSKRVVVFGKTNISFYRGQHDTKSQKYPFDPQSVVTTMSDNVIVADRVNSVLHIVNNVGHLLTTYDTKDIGISHPISLAICLVHGKRSELYIGCWTSKDTSDKANLCKINISGNYVL